MASDGLVAACGGTEQPFTVNGRRWLYCWQRSTGRHCYLDLDTDIAVWHPGFHPAFAPELEFEPLPEQPRKVLAVELVEDENFYW